MKTKISIICKGVQTFSLNANINLSHKPKAGDVAIFEVIDIGKHDCIQSTNGNNAYIFPGDHIMMAFGNRYATAQFEGYVPETYLDVYHILGKGGAVGEVASMNIKLKDIGPTNLKLIGYAVDDSGLVINTKYLKEEPIIFDSSKNRLPHIILSIGSSMDSGKTTTAGYLCRGLSLAGKKTAFIKLTGTVYSKDKSFVRDCGAEIALDFSNAGFPSTYLCSEQELLNLYEWLFVKTQEYAPDYIVIEIADGLLQRETDFLLKNDDFMKDISGLIFSCGDSLSALSGIRYIEGLKQKIIGISGLFTCSELLIKEVQAHSKYPVYTIFELSDPNFILNLETKIKQL